MTTTNATGEAYLHSDEMTLILTNLPPASAVTLACEPGLWSSRNCPDSPDRVLTES